MREYDYGNEHINVEKDLPIRCVILAKYNPELNKALRVGRQKLTGEAEEGGIAPPKEDVVFSRVTGYSVVIDDTKYFEVRLEKYSNIVFSLH